MLAAERPLLADLRYVRLLDLARQEDASPILKMKKGRNRLQSDLYPPYHPLLLTMLRVRPPDCVACQPGQQASKHAHVVSAL